MLCTAHIPEIVHLELETFTQSALERTDQLRSHEACTLYYESLLVIIREDYIPVYFNRLHRQQY